MATHVAFAECAETPLDVRFAVTGIRDNGFGIVAASARARNKAIAPKHNIPPAY